MEEVPDSAAYENPAEKLIFSRVFCWINKILYSVTQEVGVGFYHILGGTLLIIALNPHLKKAG